MMQNSSTPQAEVDTKDRGAGSRIGHFNTSKLDAGPKQGSIIVDGKIANVDAKKGSASFTLTQ